MASLLIAGTIMVHNKIKDKKEAKREKKRQAYEDRYNELQREHSAQEEKYLARSKSFGSAQGGSENVGGGGVGGVAEKEGVKRSDSRSSLKSEDELDGPARWVDEAAKRRSKG